MHNNPVKYSKSDGQTLFSEKAEDGVERRRGPETSETWERPGRPVSMSERIRASLPRASHQPDTESGGKCGEVCVMCNVTGLAWPGLHYVTPDSSPLTTDRLLCTHQTTVSPSQRF